MIERGDNVLEMGPVGQSGSLNEAKLANVGRIRKVETSGYYRCASTEGRDGASSIGRFIDIGNKSSSSTRPGSEASFTPRSTSIETSSDFSRRPSQTPSQMDSQASRAPSRVSAPAPSRAESKGKVKAYTQRNSVFSTIDDQEWILT